MLNGIAFGIGFIIIVIVGLVTRGRGFEISFQIDEQAERTVGISYFQIFLLLAIVILIITTIMKGQ